MMRTQKSIALIVEVAPGERDDDMLHRALCAGCMDFRLT